MTLQVLTLDLKDDPQAVAAYRRHHAAVWPEVLKSLRKVGVRSMDIYALGRRLVMLMDTRPGFSAKRDFKRHVASHPRCAEWEALMSTFQQPPPGAPRGRLWTEMEEVFSLRRQLRRAGKRRSAR
jgi:L-rhamnose mutarotase